jgi:hypothetical protein
MEKYDIVRFTDSDLSLDVTVSPDEETVWLTQDQIAVLFGKSRPVISRHIAKIFSDKELEENTSVHFLHGTPSNRPPKFYNLDVILAVGYRVNGKRGIEFRRWANSVLKDYLIKGYAINGKRVDDLCSGEHCSVKGEVEALKQRMALIEKSKIPDDKLFFSGQFYDAFSFLTDLVASADQSICLVDPYCDSKALNVLAKKKGNVLLQIVSSSSGKLTEADIGLFEKEYGPLCRVNSSLFHDRYLILDAERVYRIGSSLNYLGNKMAEISLLEDDFVKKTVIQTVEVLFHD